jgi:signal transduction histidine kinase
VELAAYRALLQALVAVSERSGPAAALIVARERGTAPGESFGQLVGDLAARRRRLEVEKYEFTRLAVRRERVRIARDLHDVVGHHLAVMVIQAGAGRMTCDRHVDGAAQRFESIRQSGHHALGDVARLIDILHAGSRETPPSGRLQVLLDEAHAGGLNLHVSPLPHDVGLALRVQDVAYRVVQEGLTNAIKHAPGARIDVRLSLRGDWLEVQVRDAGHTAPSTLATTGSGLGLSGMRTRIESLGGNLDAGPDPSGGWLLRAQLPLTTPTDRPSTVARNPRLPPRDDRKIAIKDDDPQTPQRLTAPPPHD